jgi:hypothetical protein
MLTHLGAAFSGWRPSAGVPGDPLATVRAAWSEIVGDDVARAAQPVALTGTALVIVTASGSWSHQLSFLERQIIASVNALGVHSVERLRFRVGVVRPRGAFGDRRVTRPGGVRPANEALARLRTVVEGHRAAHRLAGGAFCGSCGGATAGATRCRPCADSEERAVRERCERVLFETPWLAPDEVLDAVSGLAPEAYLAIRRRLLRSWIDELRLARKRFEVRAPIDTMRVRKLASSYVLLETRMDPNRLELDSPVRQNALGDLYGFIRTVEDGAP